MRCIDEVSADEVQNKRVIVRADYNLPLDGNGEVADLFRLKRGWQTVQYLKERGSKVIIITHIGRDPEESTEPIARAMQHFGKVTFVPDLIGPTAHDIAAAMQSGDVVLLQNLRSNPGETDNDENFAKALASLGELYVDDAFAAAHRAHASMVGIPKYLPAYAGFLMRDEIQQIAAARTPETPSFAILGGAKFETKAPLIKLLLEKYDRLFIVGALANDVFKAKGLPVGRSLISKELPDTSVLQNPRLVAPADVTVETTDKNVSVKKPQDVGADDKIVDIGPDSVAAVAPFIGDAQFILWNGPTGLYEDGYVHYTTALGELIAQSSAPHKVIGGGDTIAVIEEAKLPQEKLGFLSTGGGAMLEYLLKGTLPAIEALG